MSESRLDGAAARFSALAVAMVAAAVLVYIERDRFLIAEEEPADPAQAAYEACYREGTQAVGTMLADGLIDEEKAGLFRLRAEARCRAQHPSP